MFIHRFPAFLGDFDVPKKKVFYLSQPGAVVIRRRGWQLQRQVSLDGTGPAVEQQNEGFKKAVSCELHLDIKCMIVYSFFLDVCNIFMYY